MRAGKIRAFFDAIARALSSSGPVVDRIAMIADATGGPVELARMGVQAVRDAADADRWHAIQTRSEPVPVLDLLAAITMAITQNLVPDGVNDHDTLVTLVELVDCEVQRQAVAQAQLDAADAELWRFFLRTIGTDNPEVQIMDALAHEQGLLDIKDEGDAGPEFAAYIAEGLRRFKAGA